MTGSALLKIIAFVAPLAFDTMAVAMVLGLQGVRPLRPAITFAQLLVGNRLITGGQSESRGVADRI